MKKWPLLFIAFSPLAQGAETDLRRCYEWALASHEGLARQRETIAQAQARGRVALSGALPNVAWEWRGTRQDTRGLQNTFGGFIERDQIESKFTLDQSIYHGFREWSARAGFKKEAARDLLLLKRSEILLFADVATLYYNVVALQNAVTDTDSARRLAEGRLQDLREFLRLGKTRASEVHSAESQAARLRAEVTRLKSRLRGARAELAFLTQRPLGDNPLPDGLDAAPGGQPLEKFLDGARRRSDLEAQRRDAEGREYNLRYERADRYPTLGLTAHWYTRRPTLYEPIDWDASLSLRAPLYQGGRTVGTVAEVRSQKKQSELYLRELARRIDTDVRRAYDDWVDSGAEIADLAAAQRAAEASHNAQVKEYRLGLVTNLDVLMALQTLLDAKRALDDARIESRRRYVALMVAAEVLP
ncbi:MAG: TolC family protein [Elusimicrobia bacterium]|nr:TolC family protein [Elusimicrobiota bacterium]MBK7208053.1 TolC family protein [Elusimicrobiota bacterium]MBK7544831.1 TolC family protein [Elusimicrobiota bacterium]MBK7574343.1 TolC family protein [Elusimicrobiota bacterium]MBK8126490.1 TolC family protein [Elusimicrobiota bacterium]